MSDRGYSSKGLEISKSRDTVSIKLLKDNIKITITPKMSYNVDGSYEEKYLYQMNFITPKANFSQERTMEQIFESIDAGEEGAKLKEYLMKIYKKPSPPIKAI